jgi:hypothetical protein
MNVYSKLQQSRLVNVNFWFPSIITKVLYTTLDKIVSTDRQHLEYSGFGKNQEKELMTQHESKTLIFNLICISLIRTFFELSSQWNIGIKNFGDNTWKPKIDIHGFRLMLCHEFFLLVFSKTWVFQVLSVCRHNLIKCCLSVDTILSSVVCL